MIESLERRRLLAIVRPDSGFGTGGELPPPPDLVAGQSDWLVRVVDAPASGVVTAFATATVRFGNGFRSLARVVHYSAAGDYIADAKPVPVVADVGRNRSSAEAWFNPADDATWVIPSTPTLARGADGRPTSAGFSLARIGADGRLLGTVRVTPQRVQAGDVWKSDEFYGVSFNSDGTAFVTVRQLYQKQNRLQLLKYDRSGTLDTRFGSGGSVVLPVGYETTLNSGVMTQATPDGGVILAVGQTNAVYTARGKLANTIDGKGRIPVDVRDTSTDNLYYRLGIDKQGRVVVMDDIGADRPYLTRWLSDGTRDASFGRVRLPEGNWYAQRTVFADDGSFVLLGNNVRVTAAGQLDAAWLQTGQAVKGDTGGLGGFLGGNRSGYLDTAGRFYDYAQTGDGTPVTRRYAAGDSGVSLVDGTLGIVGRGAADTVDVRRSGANVVVTFNGTTQTFAASAVLRQRADLFAGDDSFRSTLAVPIVLNAGAGDDTLTTGDGHAEIDLGGGSNTLAAGDGGGVVSRDAFVRFGSTLTEADTVAAGRGEWDLRFGYNYVSGSNGTFVLTGGRYSLRTGDGNQHVTVDSELPASIVTFNGNDTVVTGSGNDYIDVGLGQDVVRAGAGNDRVYGGYGDDSIDGGAGDDTLVGGGKNDTLAGQDGNDRLYAGTPGVADDDAVRNVITGGAGNDLLFAGTPDDDIRGVETVVRPA